MMDIVYAVITALKADSAIATACGTRIYRKRLPTNPTFPAITVQAVDKIRDSDTNTGRYGHSRIQCTSWATTPGPDEDISEMCADALHRLTNTRMTYGTNKGVYVVSIIDAGGVPDENTEIPLYMEHRDFWIEYDYYN